MLDMGPIEERLGALRSRPWQFRSAYIECTDNQGDDQVLMRVEEEYGDAIDLAFIAHAPEDIEALVAEVKKLRTLIWTIYSKNSILFGKPTQSDKVPVGILNTGATTSNPCTQQNNT